MKLVTFFDYIFFRVYLFFLKKNDSIAEEKATNLVTLFQSFIIFDSVFALTIFNICDIPDFLKNKWLLGLPPIVILGIFNHLHFKGNLKKTGYKRFYDTWGKEERKRKKKMGWIIFITIVFIIFGVFPSLIAIKKLLL